MWHGDAMASIRLQRSGLDRTKLESRDFLLMEHPRSQRWSTTVGVNHLGRFHGSECDPL